MSAGSSRGFVYASRGLLLVPVQRAVAVMCACRDGDQGVP
jgi:hypothetical protein